MPAWLTSEVKLLQELHNGIYGPATYKDVNKLFPRHSSISVQRRFYKLGLKSSRNNLTRASRLERAVKMQDKVFL